MIYTKYLVRESDHFHAHNFPQIESDMDAINKAISKASPEFNKEMLLSFLKDHSMRTENIEANPVLAEMISSKSLPISNLEALFESCKTNIVFRKQLEEFVTSDFQSSSVY